MIGYSVSVLLWNLYWVYRSISKYKNINYFKDMYTDAGWLSVFLWLYSLSGFVIFIYYLFK